MTAATFGTVWSSVLPLISAEILSNIQWISLLILPQESYVPYSDFSDIFALILVALVIILLGFTSNAFPFTTPRAFLVISSIAYIIGYVLLTVVDDKFYNFSFGLSLREPFGYTVPGLLFTQFAISLLQLTGRSLIFTRFGPVAQPSAQTWATTLTLLTSFVFRFIFGFVFRSNTQFYNPFYTRCATIPFAAVGLIVIFLSIFLTPFPETERAAVDWGSLTSIREVSNFFRLAVPLFIALLVYTALDFATPSLAVQLESTTYRYPDSWGIAVVALGLLAFVGILGAWLPKWLGIQGGFVVALFVSAAVQAISVFQYQPASRALCIVVTVFSGLGLGAALAGGWATLGIAVPGKAAGKYVGLFVGVLGALQVVPVLVKGSAGSINFLAIVFLVIAGILGFGLPEGSGQGGEPGYASIEPTAS